MTSLPPRRPTIVALAIAFGAFSLIAGLGSQRILTESDTPRYKVLAHNLLEHGVFSSCSAGPHLPEFERMPGYPAFMALAYAVSGGHDYAVIVGQALLQGLATFMLFVLAWTLVESAGFALLAAACWALYPFSIYYGIMLMTEGVVAPLMIIAVSLLALYARRGQRWTLAAAALTIVVASYTRPNLAAVPVFLAALGLAVRRLRGTRATLGLLWMSAAAVVTQVPWAVRNYAAFDRVMFTSHNYIGLNLCESSMEFRRDLDEIQRVCSEGVPADFHNICDFRENERLDAVARERGLRELRAAPGSFIALMPFRAVRIWLSWESGGRLSRWLVMGMRVGSLVAMFPFIWGLWLLWRKSDLGWLPVGVCLFISLSHTVLYVSGRYAMPARGFYVLAIAYALWGLMHGWRALLRGRFREITWPQRSADPAR